MNKFNVGQSIKVKDPNFFGEECKGHIVLIMYDENIEPVYYCSMYPGALPNWEWFIV